MRGQFFAFIALSLIIKSFGTASEAENLMLRDPPIIDTHQQKSLATLRDWQQAHLTQGINLTRKVDYKIPGEEGSYLETIGKNEAKHIIKKREYLSPEPKFTSLQLADGTIGISRGTKCVILKPGYELPMGLQLEAELDLPAPERATSIYRFSASPLPQSVITVKEYLPYSFRNAWRKKLSTNETSSDSLVIPQVIVMKFKTERLELISQTVYSESMAIIGLYRYTENSTNTNSGDALGLPISYKSLDNFGSIDVTEDFSTYSNKISKLLE